MDLSDAVRREMQIIDRGLVEYRLVDTPMAVFREGDVLTPEMLAGAGTAMIAAGSVSVLSMNGDAERARIGLTNTAARMAEWATTYAMNNTHLRVLTVLRKLADGDPVAMTVSELARLSRLSRVWATKIVADLVSRGQLVREDGLFIPRGDP